MRKFKKNQVIITALAIMIAIAGYINYTGNLTDVMSDNVENATGANGTNVNAADVNSSAVNATDAAGNPIDAVSGDILSNDAEPDNVAAGNNQLSEEQQLQEPGSVILTSGTGISDSIISAAKLNREQIRAKNKEALLEIINNQALAEAAKTEAVAKLSDITDNSEKEIAAELLLEAKGFNGVVVSVLDGNVDVVVSNSELTDTQRAQIEDIVKRKTGVTADKITINICNNQNN